MEPQQHGFSPTHVISIFSFPFLCHCPCFCETLCFSGSLPIPLAFRVSICLHFSRWLSPSRLYSIYLYPTPAPLSLTYSLFRSLTLFLSFPQAVVLFGGTVAGFSYVGERELMAWLGGKLRILLRNSTRYLWEKMQKGTNGKYKGLKGLPSNGYGLITEIKKPKASQNGQIEAQRVIAWDENVKRFYL